MFTTKRRLIMNFQEYLTQRITDLEQMKAYLPEITATLDIAIETTEKSKKYEGFSAAWKAIVEKMLGHEVSFQEVDLFMQLIVSAAVTSMDPNAVPYLDSESFLDILCEKLVSRITAVVGYDPGPEYIKDLKDTLSAVYSQ
jgi:hypothetical protein